MGSGFGGLGAALTAAEQGAKVLVLEALRYPGGCASSFTRGGHAYESGATLFSGFAPGQLFAEWMRKHQLAVQSSALSPMVRFRAGFALDVTPDRDHLIEQFCAMPGAPTDALRKFFAYQTRVADVLWAQLGEPIRLSMVPMFAPLVGRSLGSVLRRFGVANFAPLRSYLDAVCQITVQTSSEDAEAPFALAAMDYYFRGTHHVHGGIGVLAQALCDAIERLGGHVRFGERVTQISDRFVVHTAKRNTYEARVVIANLLPDAASKLRGKTLMPRVQRRVEEGWGACMLYRVLAETQSAGHYQLVGDPSQPLRDGNHVFCSVDDSGRVMTVSTHVRADADVPLVQARMRETIAARAPELSKVESEMTASPRTWQRFVGRSLVGGIPRTRGLHHYLALRTVQPERGLFLVGDSFLFGQSTLACALSGKRTALAALRGRLK